MDRYKVGYLVGSFSSTSINRLLAKALAHLAPPELELSEIPIKELPITARTTMPTFRQPRAPSRRP